MTVKIPQIFLAEIDGQHAVMADTFKVMHDVLRREVVSRCQYNDDGQYFIVPEELVQK